MICVCRLLYNDKFIKKTRMFTMSELNTNFGLDLFCFIVLLLFYLSSFFLQIKVMHYDGIIQGFWITYFYLYDLTFLFYVITHLWSSMRWILTSIKWNNQLGIYLQPQIAGLPSQKPSYDFNFLGYLNNLLILELLHKVQILFWSTCFEITYLVTSKQSGRFFQFFVAYSKHLNFIINFVLGPHFLCWISGVVSLNTWPI